VSGNVTRLGASASRARRRTRYDRWTVSVEQGQQPLPPRSRQDLTRWYVAAAVFWFETLGLLALGAAILMAPLSCFGDPSDPFAPSPCAGGPPFLRDGTAVVWFLAVVGVGLLATVLWIATVGHPRLRGTAFGLLGLAALAPIGWTIVLGEPVGVLMLFTWTGVPAILLLGTAFRLLARPGP
jgi:hypothetical protein